MSEFDIAIIGAGIAGASLAAEVAAHRSVILIEAEAHPGYHSTGPFCSILGRELWRSARTNR